MLARLLALPALALLTSSALAQAPAVAACPVVQDCRLTAQAPAKNAKTFAHKRNYFYSSADPTHRARDLLLVEGDTQWVLAKFAYGLFDKDLKDEPVDIWVLRGCGGTWEQLGTATTTRSDGVHPIVEGMKDTGGRVYFEIPKAQRLGLGMHRVQLVVRGDRSRAEAWIQVVPKGSEVVVSDIDGTLTTGANVEFSALARGVQPTARPGAAALFNSLQQRGFPIYYLSSRPGWLTERSHGFLTQRGFPMGAVHTSVSKVGELKVDPADYKTAQLARLRTRGLVPVMAFGDKTTDARAWRDGGVPERYLIALEGPAHGGTQITDYRQLAPTLAERRPGCAPSVKPDLR
jgi:hypothetical protein